MDILESILTIEELDNLTAKTVFDLDRKSQLAKTRAGIYILLPEQKEFSYCRGGTKVDILESWNSVRLKDDFICARLKIRGNEQYGAYAQSLSAKYGSLITFNYVVPENLVPVSVAINFFEITITIKRE